MGSSSIRRQHCGMNGRTWRRTRVRGGNIKKEIKTNTPRKVRPSPDSRLHVVLLIPSRNSVPFLRSLKHFLLSRGTRTRTRTLRKQHGQDEKRFGGYAPWLGRMKWRSSSRSRTPTNTGKDVEEEPLLS